MVEQNPAVQEDSRNVGWALLIPVLAFLVALLLLFTRSPTVDPGSASIIAFPEIFGGENLRSALRSILIQFGLSVLPGGLIGLALGGLIVRSSNWSRASLRFLRIGQWAPFLIWWVIAEELLIPWDVKVTRYFFVWAIGAPAVALAACYHFLTARLTLGLERRRVVSEVGRAVVLQGFFISVLLDMSVGVERWIIYPGMKGRPISYAVLVSLVVSLLAVNWVFRSSFDHTASVRGEILLGELRNRDSSSLWRAMLLVLLGLAAWQVLSGIGLLRTSPVDVLKALVFLISGGEIGEDISVSLVEIFGGIILGGGVALLATMGLSGGVASKTLMLALLPVTYVAPIALLPVWLGWLGYVGSVWSILCVAHFAFFPFVQALWGLHEQPFLCKILLAADDALPYAFTAIIYADMTNATAGLGFAVVVAGAAYQIDKGVAVFLLTMVLFVAISSTLRWLAKRLYSSTFKNEAPPAGSAG